MDAPRLHDPHAPIAFIVRYYDDDQRAETPWVRTPRLWHPASEWEAVVVIPSHDAPDVRDFDEIDEALAWARERADSIFVRLGSVEDAHYSAGVVHLHERNDGTGSPYPQWPPDRWPDYEGPARESRCFKPKFRSLGASSSSATLGCEVEGNA